MTKTFDQTLVIFLYFMIHIWLTITQDTVNMDLQGLLGQGIRLANRGAQ